MNDTLLYFTRHGETDYNRRRIMQGRRIDAPLNDRGLAQARALAERFADVSLDVLYTSSLRRARQTGAAVAARHAGLPVHALADLDEMSWGVLEGEPVQEVLQTHLKPVVAQWEAGEYDGRIPEGESIREVQTRGLQAVETIAARHVGQTVLVVSHGRWLRVVLASLLDGYGLARMEAVAHANTGVYRLCLADGCYRAELMNCTTHLEALEGVSAS